MALVDYSSSDEGEDEDEQKGNETDQETTNEAATGNLNLKRKRQNENQSPSDLPPLPSKFHDLYASTSRVSTRDDPSLHGGRKRVTPHIEGNWPTHLYIEWYPATAEYESLSKLVSKLKGLPQEESNLHSFLTSDLGAPLPLHISLSRPIGFSTELKDDFVTSLETAMKFSGIRPFDFAFSALDWVANFENTRWFLVLRIQKPEFDSLNKLLHVCNTTVQDYGQPPLYAKASTTATSGNTTKSPKWPKQETSKNRSSVKAYWSNLQDVSEAFHISIAWTLGSPSKDLLALTESVATDYFQDVAQTCVNIQEIKAKVGNTVTNMPLHTNIQEATGLFSF